MSMDSTPPTPDPARTRVLSALGVLLLALGLRALCVTPELGASTAPPRCLRWVQVGEKEAPLLCLPPKGNGSLHVVGLPSACLALAAKAPLVGGDCLVPTPEGCRRERMAPALITTLSIAVPVNRADEAELATLPGIGPSLARRIVADRRANGPYHSEEALTRVAGIGPRLVARLRPRLVF